LFFYLLTRLRVPAAPGSGISNFELRISNLKTHAISFFSSVSNYARSHLSFSTTRFFDESGCKDTTFFHTDKIFFQKKFHGVTSALCHSNIQNKKNYSPTLWTGVQITPGVAKKAQKSTHRGQKQINNNTNH
jgi:hypothetical protein